MNSMPAASKDFLSAAVLALVLLGMPSEASTRLIVLVLTPLNFANSVTLQRSACLADLICELVIIDKAKI
jgi:hypothetical protein